MIAFAKRLAMGCVVAMMFFAFVEVILSVFGVVPLYESSDPYVGFAGYSPLFVEDRTPDGEQVYRTASNKLEWFNPQQFSTRKAPGTTRVFCLGGSTTFGRPYDDRTSFCGWLRSFLAEADPERNWEVVNAGGVSYASYRIVRLIDELAGLDPDLFIIYTGHNEFLEKRTYGPLLDTPTVVRDAASLATRLRLYTLLSDFANQKGDVLSSEVQAVLDRSVGPEEYHRDDDIRDAVLEHFRSSLERMVLISRRAGSQLIFVTPASNIGDFSPFKSEPSDGLTEEEVRQVSLRKLAAEAAIREGDPLRAATLADQALSMDERDPDVLFLRGRALRAVGNTGEARRTFAAARDEDIAPLRALTKMVETVADVAHENGTGFVDFVRLVDAESPDGIPGSELFLDHVHPTIDGNRMLALALVDKMIQTGMVTPASTWNADSISEITDRVKGSLDEQAHALALKKLSNVLLWAGKVDEAERLENLAGATAWDDVNTRLQKAALLRRSGRVEEALSHYAEAIRIAPDNPAIRLEYGIFLSELGRRVAARSELETAVELDGRSAGAHYELGVVLKALGEVEAAEAAYRSAISLDPDNADAYNNLGVIEAQRGNIRSAADLFAKAVRADPDHRNAAENLARARSAMQ
ncbi:MAG: tetratricopeptide repeat protein [Rhodothermia bacterium]|nr:tetratricopeptide repeat protein [Rhodothermia bacterium]